MSDRLLRTGDQPPRFFLVPAGIELPPGDLLVRTFDGRSHAVAAEVIAPYEIDRERAAAHFDARVDRVFGQVRGAFRDLFGGSSEAGPGSPEPPDAESGAGSSTRAGGFARWLGVTPGEVLVDPEKRRQGRRALLEKAGRLVRPDLTDADLDAVEARLDRMGEAIARDRQRLEEQTDLLADRIEERRPEVEAAAKQAGERLVELGQSALQQLDRIGRQLSARAEGRDGGGDGAGSGRASTSDGAAGRTADGFDDAGSERADLPPADAAGEAEEAEGAEEAEDAVELGPPGEPDRNDEER